MSEPWYFGWVGCWWEELRACTISLIFNYLYRSSSGLVGPAIFHLSQLICAGVWASRDISVGSSAGGRSAGPRYILCDSLRGQLYQGKSINNKYVTRSVYNTRKYFLYKSLKVGNWHFNSNQACYGYVHAIHDTFGLCAVHSTCTVQSILFPTLKVHKNENFFGFDFEFCPISLLVMHK